MHINKSRSGSNPIRIQINHRIRAHYISHKQCRWYYSYTDNKRYITNTTRCSCHKQQPYICAHIIDRAYTHVQQWQIGLLNGYTNVIYFVILIRCIVDANRLLCAKKQTQESLLQISQYTIQYVTQWAIFILIKTSSPVCICYI